MKDKKKDFYNYDKNYGKIMGMSNAGFTPDQIADSLNIPKFKVIETIQIAYGRTLMFGRNRAK